MTLKKSLARVLIAVALRLFFLRHKVDLLEREDHGNMGELYVYEFEAFRLYITNDRGDYYAQLTQSTPADIWKLSLILEYLGVTEEGDGLMKFGLPSLLKELWLLGRNMARVRELFGGENAGHAQSELNEFEAGKYKEVVEGMKRAAGY